EQVHRPRSLRATKRYEKCPMPRWNCPRCALPVAAMLLAAFSLGLAPISAAGRPPAAGKPQVTVDYNFHIRPLLADRCFVCHGPDANKRKAGLRLDLPENALGKGVIVPGKPAESPVVQRITAADVHERMPPAKSNLSLSRHEIALIRRWIAEGAEYK